jgi:predicted Zn-dependent protease
MVQVDHSLKRLAAGFTAAALLSACSLLAPHPPSSQPPTPQTSSPQPPGSPAPLQSPPPAPAPQVPPPARENHLSAATRSLVTQARTQVAHGDLPAASSTLDRALRIEPNNPLLWVELGRLRLAESDAHQAEGCGRKALALASGDRIAQAQAGRLLADALRGQGRNQEARQVESQPFMNSSP